MQGGAASWDSSGCEKICRPGLRSCESSGFRGNARVFQFHATNHSVNKRVVLLRGLRGAAGFCMFQLRVQERAAAPTLPVTLPEPVSKSFLHVGDVVMRRQDTSCARVQVIEPFVGDMCVALRFL